MAHAQNLSNATPPPASKPHTADPSGPGLCGRSKQRIGPANFGITECLIFQENLHLPIKRQNSSTFRCACELCPLVDIHKSKRQGSAGGCLRQDCGAPELSYLAVLTEILLVRDLKLTMPEGSLVGPCYASWSAMWP